MTNGFEFGVGLVNFALLLFLFKIFMTDPLRVVAQEREEKARRDMEEAEALLLEAKAHLQRYQGLIQNIEEEKKQIELSGLQDAQVARERLAESAQDGARQILERAQFEVAAERSTARAELRQGAAQATVRRAEDLLRSSLDGAAQRDILQNLLSKVGSPDAR
ncbi:MAG: F0F1 ATP synthase subunit B [Burkholderiales bacterium]|nr:F0F1 ATP synthase subunit B [Burkholderiales bacterium]